MPCVPGRKYLAVAESSVSVADGTVFVGTKDTVLAKIKDGNVFSFGQVISAGGIHSLDATSDGEIYGVAGHSEGCGMLFKYNEALSITGSVRKQTATAMHVKIAAATTQNAGFL